MGEGGRIALLREDEGETFYFQGDSVCATIFHSRTIEDQCVFKGELQQRKFDDNLEMDGHGMGATSLAGDSLYIAFMCIDSYLNVVVLCILDMTISAKCKWRHA